MDEWIRTRNDEVAWEEGCRPDPAAAERVREFFRRFLRHSKGEFAGKPFDLLPWQWDRVVRPMFGWKRPDGTRRIRRAYIEIPKKNGKSTLCAGLALYMLIGDGERGAEVYSAAADRRQASIVYEEMRAMIEASPALSSYLALVPSKKRVNFSKANSFFESLSADAKTKEGYNISGLIFDELHAQPNRRLWESLEYGGASRRQPLAISITTAGHDRTSICWEQHAYAEQVSQGSLVDTSYLGVIYGAALQDDWTSPETWARANPSYGASIRPDEMREACQAAMGSPLKENSFKRYRLNIWTQQNTLWHPLSLWDANTRAVETRGPAYGGLDLASTTDLASLCWYFPETRSAVWRYWTTDRACKERERTNRERLDVWVSQKHITRHKGATIDYNLIREDVLADAKKYKVKELAVDRWNAVHLATTLRGDGIPMVAFGQGYASLSAPMKHVETLLLGGDLAHGGNPVARWNFGNVSASEDPAGNIKPNKGSSVDKIDGFAALLMGVGRAIVAENPTSVYSTRGIREV